MLGLAKRLAEVDEKELFTDVVFTSPRDLGLLLTPKAVWTDINSFLWLIFG
jgi:hypothetical protein